MTLPSPPGHKIGRIMLVLAWLAALGLLTLYFNAREQKQLNPNRQPGGFSDLDVTEVVLERNRAGHYVASGTINGEATVFLLDTGATDVVVSQDLAERIGLRAGARHYAQTANGRIQVRSTRLDSLELGKITLRDVSASINPAMSGNQVLLGMSALQQVEFTQRGNQLTLRYYHTD
ncbi:TIGR02281 family clan AA aspartic protease [Marinimicrobium sp. ABcell2]|uniref:retropepsin-like aspartic protease family protein n=1 Tax=Marinimicrobium sp. ABcell2 TaxID=3069751 RepID=UPI0027B6E394|nr:TIGR02281 family clan AA aspartic protease [Marinimicrobium sp. ABcell2]MDQ2078301.1 TIGR02281 family clan AA aspartic protease [Marinimicrobium sp. ABcell2]